MEQVLTFNRFYRNNPDSDYNREEPSMRENNIPICEFKLHCELKPPDTGRPWPSENSDYAHGFDNASMRVDALENR